MDPEHVSANGCADIVVTIPLGVVSDFGHRRLVLCLNLCGLSLVYLWIVLVGYLRFPIQAMLVGPFFSLVGGGECVLMSSVAAVITEISPDESIR
jgi:MFS family permease